MARREGGQPIARRRWRTTPAAEQAASVWIVPALKRKIATIAATDRTNAQGLTLASAGAANEIARLRITPTTAAVIPASAPFSGLWSRSFSMKGAPSPIHRKHGTKVVQVANSPPKVPASIGGKVAGSR